MPKDVAEIYTLTFSIPDLIRREEKLNEKDDSISGLITLVAFVFPLSIENYTYKELGYAL